MLASSLTLMEMKTRSGAIQFDRERKTGSAPINLLY